MKIIKPNKKTIASFAAGAIIFSSITGFAVNQYFASDIKYTNDKTVSQALNELYAMKENKYTTEEYQNYGNEKYTEGINANEEILANEKGYKTGIYTCKVDKEKKWIDCGFKPRYVVISLETVGQTDNNSVFYYKEGCSTTKSFMSFTSTDNQALEYVMEGKNGTIASETKRHIYGVDNTGFGFFFSAANRTIYYTAFK